MRQAETHLGDIIDEVATWNVAVQDHLRTEDLMKRALATTFLDWRNRSQHFGLDYFTVMSASSASSASLANSGGKRAARARYEGINVANRAA